MIRSELLRLRFTPTGLHRSPAAPRVDWYGDGHDNAAEVRRTSTRRLSQCESDLPERIFFSV